jgi:hypothetical protein
MTQRSTKTKKWRRMKYLKKEIKRGGVDNMKAAAQGRKRTS